MQTQELQQVTKDTQKLVLKTICEFPTLNIEELSLTLKSRGKNIAQEEILQVLHSISPNKNWHRATKEEIQNEILEYVWTLESQILFLLPTKQKETTIAEFNQLRLQNKQVKVSKDLIRHVQSLLQVDSKNLSKFRKFEKELSLQSDLDPNTQAIWLIRILLANFNLNQVQSTIQLPQQLASEFQEKFPGHVQKVGKTLQRISERLIEKYFPKGLSEDALKHLVKLFQSIHNAYKKGQDEEVFSKGEFHDQNKLVQTIANELHDVQKIISESHEGGFLSKLVKGKLKNREGIIKKIDDVISSLNQITDIGNQTNKTVNEKVLLVQKLQSDYENVVLVKSQLENDLYNLNEKFKQIEEKCKELEKELEGKTNSLERAHEKIASLQQKVDTIPEHEMKTNQLRDDLSTAKSIAISLHQRLSRLKSDLFNKPNERQRNNKTANMQKVNNGNNAPHKVQQDAETIQVTPIAEAPLNT